jgi:hypothetical protein
MGWYAGLDHGIAVLHIRAEPAIDIVPDHIQLTSNDLRPNRMRLNAIEKAICVGRSQAPTPFVDDINSQERHA